MGSRSARTFCVAMLVVIGSLTLACARRQPAPAAGATASAPSPAGAEAPAGSPLAQIRPGMSTTQVSEILGPPAEQTNHMTGKGFIPYYMGPDAVRFTWHYKGIGRVVFNVGHPFGGSSSVIKTEYDPSEDGRR